jgi:phosphoribosylformylglycinamidine (FGAM) synthase PurS component
MKVRVLVRLKPGIMDVQGAAVKRALAAWDSRKSKI